MAVNSGGVYFILFGVYSFVSDPNSAILLDIVNELFFTNITHEQILEFIETWKTHLSVSYTHLTLPTIYSV